MGELTTVLSIIKASPTESTLVLSALFIAAMLFLNARKVNMDAVTSINKAQSENLTALMSQNQTLANDLHAMRQHQAALYSQLDAMRDEVRSARDELADTRRHVLKLEGLVRQYQSRCDSCPNGPGPVIQL